MRAHAHATAAATSPAPAHPAQPAPAKPPVVLGYFSSAHELKRVVDMASQAGFPKGTPIYVGNYGINPKEAAIAHAKGMKYAPMLGLLDKGQSYYKKRGLPAKQEAKIKGWEKGYSGHIPEPAQLPRLTPSQRLHWGMEYGMRLRDHMRESKVPCDAWQLDEILGESGQPGNAPLRQFERGVLNGLHTGRPELGDKPMKGITWMAGTSLSTAGMRGGEVDRFWKSINQASFSVMGEEYPKFEGSPRAASDGEASARELLKREGGARAEVAAKFGAGMTPGYRPGANDGLGGDVLGEKRGWVNAWRSAYMSEAVKDGAHGLGEYNWLPGNQTDQVIRDVLGEMAAAAKREK
jgi:hypothetical protein